MKSRRASASGRALRRPAGDVRAAPRRRGSAAGVSLYIEICPGRTCMGRHSTGGLGRRADGRRAAWAASVLTRIVPGAARGPEARPTGQRPSQRPSAWWPHGARWQDLAGWLSRESREMQAARCLVGSPCSVAPSSQGAAPAAGGPPGRARVLAEGVLVARGGFEARPRPRTRPKWTSRGSGESGARPGHWGCGAARPGPVPWAPMGGPGGPSESRPASASYR